MTTREKSKKAPKKGSPKKTSKAPASKVVKVKPRKAAPAAKPSSKKTAPAKKATPGKAAPAAHAKDAWKPAPTPKPAKKSAPLPAAAVKDLTKKTVKTVPPSAPKAPANPAAKAAIKLVAKAPAKPVAKAPVKPAVPAIPKKPRFSAHDLEHFRVELLAMRDRITGQSGSMRNDALQRTDEINPEEDGTDAFLRLQTLEQVSSQQLVITNIDEALRAIEQGTYGVCDMCGDLINKPRLTVLPFAQNCIKCQSEMERARRPGGRR